MAAKSSTVSPARREAFAILLEVERGHSHADDLLRSHRVSALSAQDRNLCTTLVMGTSRWQIRLDAAIRPLLAKPNARLDPEIQIALRLGAFQLHHLDRIPAHAAIDESVALAKHAGHKFASGMVNAVLRKLAALPKSQPLSAPSLNATKLAEAAAHPAWLVERWAANYGFRTAQAICEHGQQQPELNIRLDDSKLEAGLEAGHEAGLEAGLEAELIAEGIHLEPGALLTAAHRVLSGDITATQLFRSGRLRIQEEGSQLIAELTGHGTSIVDCCAAPGGKTLILAERNPQATITACELSATRLEAMRQRIAVAQNTAQIQFLQADAAQFTASPVYDLVLADVPCSGTGTLGRNPEIRHRLQAADLARHHDRQCAILLGAMQTATATGQILYSTCSLEPEENAAVITEVLAQSPQWRQASLAPRIDELFSEGRLTKSGAQSLQSCLAEDGSLTLLPGSLGPDISTDGFFIALLEKHT
jgi:16S rRNA (cytosine967-C5)-methyltransferase